MATSTRATSGGRSEVGIQCFVVEETGRVQLSLRRYCEQACPGPSPFSYHNVSTVIGEAPEKLTSEGYLESLDGTVDRSDPRWPSSCVCGYAFLEDDHWQVNQHTIYRRPETGDEWVDRELPPGAIRQASWLPESDAGPLGKLLLRLPAGGLDWSVYGPSTTDDGRLGPHWTITGQLPNLSASPSINAEGVWHGFLRDGVLDPA